ncbi:MAG: hypothetical protein KDA45_02075 [Planctomycetales bacterium]|nr:hypothetical protein [Planctomycetales bacterium]
MLKNFLRLSATLLAAYSLIANGLIEHAAAAPEGVPIALANGKLQLTAPQSWQQVAAKSRIVQYEFRAPSDAKEDEPTARITIMGAGGSVEANIDRWYGQFEQPDGQATRDKAKRESFEVAGLKVHWVDIPGKFKDSMGAGPFSGGKVVLRENYRMLGAIIAGPDQGQYFIKITGPEEVVESLAADFKKMLKELQVP